MGGKGGLHVKGRRMSRRAGSENKGEPPGKVERSVSERKISPGGSAESWFHFKSGQNGNGKGGWKTKGPLMK